MDAPSPQDAPRGADAAAPGQLPQSPFGLKEPILVYSLSAISVLAALLFARGPLAEYRAGLIGAVYLLLPLAVCRIRKLDPAEYAPLEAPSSWVRTLLGPLLLAALFFPAFLFLGPALSLSPPFRTLSLPEDFGLLAATQLLVVALPEELFFRGYLQRRLDDRFPPGWRLLGVSFGPGLFLASLLFALAHFMTQPHPARLFTFFPGLAFGFLRAATSGIWASTLFHGLCNLYLEILIASGRG